MTQTEIYLFLLTDSFVSGLVLPAKHALVLTAMRIFGGYNLYIAGFIYTFGVTFAACLNYLLGKLLRSLKKTDDTSEGNKTVRKILDFLKEYGYFTALLGFVPILGPILTVFAGLVQTRFVRVIGLIFVVNVLAYVVF